MLAKYATRKLPSARSSVLMGEQGLGSRAAQRPIGLESKGLTGEATRFPGRAHLRGSIARGRSRVRGRRGQSGRKFGGTDWLRLQLMSPFQAQIPDPLRDHLPALLPPGRVRAPAVRVEFLILIGKCRFEGATMQIQFDDIGSGESLVRQIREEEFVDHAVACDAHGTLLLASRVRGHDQAAEDAFSP